MHTTKKISATLLVAHKCSFSTRSPVCPQKASNAVPRALAPSMLSTPRPCSSLAIQYTMYPRTSRISSP